MLFNIDTKTNISVSNKLAACVNIIPGLISVYEWEGKINNDEEVLMMIKTRTSRVDDLVGVLNF
jgi:periplasmic divalent cation tolerance protein